MFWVKENIIAWLVTVTGVTLLTYGNNWTKRKRSHDLNCSRGHEWIACWNHQNKNEALHSHQHLHHFFVFQYVVDDHTLRYAIFCWHWVWLFLTANCTYVILSATLLLSANICKHQQHNKKGGILSFEPIMTQKCKPFSSGLVCICFMHNSGCIAGPFCLNKSSTSSSVAHLG